MANYENIKEYGFDKLTAERQREIASKGGKKSQENRKRRKNLKEIFRMVGSMEISDERLQNKIAAMGFSKEEITWDVAVAISTYMNAVKKNDVKTVILLLKMLEVDEKTAKNNEFDEFMKEVD